jgi:RimJ/RimL family protein N-acetyltransferase
VPEWAERLRDGEQILVRPIRPEDRAELAAGMERLSPESRYRRFFTPTSQLSASQLSYLTEVDHHDHEALVAVQPETGYGIGVARFVRSADDEELAEVAVAVADSWQGRGVATALLNRLSERARAEGVRRFSAEILSHNHPMLELIDDLGEVNVKHSDHGSLEVEVELPAEGMGAELRETLRAAARGLLRVPHLLR